VAGGCVAGRTGGIKILDQGNMKPKAHAYRTYMLPVTKSLFGAKNNLYPVIKGITDISSYIKLLSKLIRN